MANPASASSTKRVKFATPPTTRSAISNHAKRIATVGRKAVALSTSSSQKTKPSHNYQVTLISNGSAEGALSVQLKTAPKRKRANLGPPRRVPIKVKPQQASQRNATRTKPGERK